MKKSEIYQIAMMAVADSNEDADVKLDIIEQLLSDRAVAKWQEEHEAKKAEEEVNNG